MNTEVLVVTNDQRELIKKTIAPEATDAELELFFYDNKRRGVHPLDKLIHFTKRKGKYVPITSIHFMRAKADDGGRAGQERPVFAGKEASNDYECLVTVYKVVGAERVPYIGMAKWKEYYPGDGDLGFMWRKMPSHMLSKCAEANALRLAFPRELAGLHVEEEVHVFDEAPSTLAAETQSARHSNTEKLKALQQADPSEGAAPASPSAPAQTVGASESAATGQGKPHDTAADAPSFPEASWQEFLSYVDDHPDRREVKELVKADYKLKTLKALPAENRAPFVLACQEKAKVNGVKFAIFLTKDGTVPA